MPPLPAITERGDLSSSEKGQDNGFSQFLTKDWDWKWNYGELYEANGVSDDGQKSTSGLSPESPLYFMEFYNQERTNEGRSSEEDQLGTCA